MFVKNGAFLAGFCLICNSAFGFDYSTRVYDGLHPELLAGKEYIVIKDNKCEKEMLKAYNIISNQDVDDIGECFEKVYTNYLEKCDVIENECPFEKSYANFEDFSDLKKTEFLINLKVFNVMLKLLDEQIIPPMCHYKNADYVEFMFSVRFFAIIDMLTDRETNTLNECFLGNNEPKVKEIVSRNMARFTKETMRDVRQRHYLLLSKRKDIDELAQADENAYTSICSAHYY